MKSADLTLASSAAFEVLIATVINHLYNDGKIDAVTVAKAAQFSENVYFGKPSGLLDQTASSVGTFVTIDFKDTANPVIKKVDFDFAKSGYSLCIVDTHGNHSDLTDDYAAVRGEMEAVAKAMGKNVLREVEYEEFFQSLDVLKEKVNDRALLRAFHFFGENERVDKAVSSLENNDFDSFKQAITESGYSSFLYNQNVYSKKSDRAKAFTCSLHKRKTP